LLRAYTTSEFDDQGREFRTHVFSVDQSAGTVSTNSLTSSLWFNHRGLEIKAADPGGLVTKTAYDGAGRAIVTYTTDGGGDSTWADAGNVTGDNVLQQDETQYDANGNAILDITRQRFDSETTTGALGNSTTAPLARVYYVASYYDAADRLIGTADFGTNGGAAFTRPSALPGASDTVLVDQTNYNAAGWVDNTVDPRGIVARSLYDNLGRVTKTISASTDGIPTNNTNKTTEFTYDGDSNLLTVKADMPGGLFQTTQYVYGVTTAGGSMINSNDVLAATRYPDKTSGNPSTSEQESYTVDALGEPLTFTDRNGNVHADTLDVLGRQTSDAVTTLGAGVDGSIRRIATAYDTGGRPYLFTSYNAASGGSIVNQVQDVFNGFGQLITEYQATSGGVNVNSTPNVQYAYTPIANNANNSRLVSMTYPNSRVLNYNYASGLDDSISRLTSISDSSATLEAYTYLGLDTVVKRAHPQSGVDLTYIKQTGESNGDAGDPYTGLDRFGRVVDQRWIPASNPGAPTDRFQYGYDRNSNVLFRNNLVNTAFGELYHASGAGNGYDQLDQLTAFSRGVLSASGGTGTPLDTIASPSHSQSWSFDALGNWTNVTTDGVSQNRTANQQNQITSITGLTTPGYDKNGNTTTDQAGNTLIFDAWNRLVTVKAGSTTLAAYGYNALGERITETHGSNTITNYYNADWQVVEERLNGTADVQYVWSPLDSDTLIERDRAPSGSGPLNERLYVQQDANGNVSALVDTSGNVQERYVYDPFGAVTILEANWSVRSSSSFAWIYLHQAGRLDTATGLYNFRNRDYSPTLGRWMQVDPLGLAPDTNAYRYVGNGPTGATDPSGLADDKPLLPNGSPAGNGPGSIDTNQLRLRLDWWQKYYQLWIENLENAGGLQDDWKLLQDPSLRASERDTIIQRILDKMDKAGTQAFKDTEAKLGAMPGMPLSPLERRYLEPNQTIIKAWTREDQQRANDAIRERERILLDEDWWLARFGPEGLLYTLLLPFAAASGGGFSGARPAPRSILIAPRGSANPAVRQAAGRGRTLHSDQPGNLPDQLRQRYPDTQFEFTKPGVAGQDVKVVGGKHPSEYPGSTWPKGVDRGDFKPDTPAGRRTFDSDQKNKWPDPTHMLPYDPTTGGLK
jgi:RHS repeat-associated protein